MKDFSYLWNIFVGTFTSVWEFLAGWISAAWHSGVSPSVPSMLGTFVLLALYLGSGFFAASVAEGRNRGRLMHFIAGLLIPYIYPVAILYLLPVYKESRQEEESGDIPVEETPEGEPAAPAQHKLKPVQQAPAKRPLHPASDESRDAETMRMTRVNASATMAQTIRAQNPVQASQKAAAPTPLKRPATYRPPNLDTLTTKMSRENIAACASVPADSAPAPEPAPAAAPPPLINQHYFASISVDQSGNHQGPFMIEMADGRILEAIRIVNPMPDMAMLEIPGEGGRPKTIRVPYSKISDIKLKSQWIEQTR